MYINSFVHNEYWILNGESVLPYSMDLPRTLSMLIKTIHLVRKAKNVVKKEVKQNNYYIL